MSNSLQPHRLYTIRLFCPRRFSKQEYWSRLPCPPPGDLPDPGIEPMSLSSPAWQANSLPLALPGKPGSPYSCFLILSILDHCKQEKGLSWTLGTLHCLILLMTIILALLFFQCKDTYYIIVSDLKGILRRNGMKMKILITTSDLRAEILYL